MKRIYGCLAAGDSTLPPAQYLLASRRALNLASMERLDEAALSFLCGGSSTLTVGQYLERVGLDPETCRGAIEAAGFGAGPDTVIPGRGDRSVLRSLFHRLEEPLLRLAAAERSAYLSYLRNQGLTDGRGLTVVDIGWHGSMQASLGRLLASAGVTPGGGLRGYYLATFGHARSDQVMAGWLVDRGQPASHFRTLRYCIELVEFLFAAPQPGLVCFEAGSNGDAAMRPVQRWAPGESARNPLIERVRAGGLAYLEASREVLDPAELPLSPEQAFSPLARLLTDPTPGEAERLGELSFCEDFGGLGERRHLGHPRGWLANLLHPKVMKEDFKTAYWRRGYYQRLSALERRLLKMITPNFKLGEEDP